MSRMLPGWWSAEVEWYQQAREGEHGLRAVPLEPSLGGNPDTMDDLRCEAATRARRVERALGCLPPRQRALLLAAHAYVGPRAASAVRAAHQEVTAQSGGLLEAATGFRRAWVASAPKRAA